MVVADVTEEEEEEEEAAVVDEDMADGISKTNRTLSYIKINIRILLSNRTTSSNNLKAPKKHSTDTAGLMVRVGTRPTYATLLLRVIATKRLSKTGWEEILKIFPSDGVGRSLLKIK